MSIASEITRLQGAKSDIKTAIEAKGVTVPSSAKLDDYDTYISQISGGGGSELDYSDITFIDYDGKVLYSYTFSEFIAAGALPANPSHTGLTAQGWNWTLQELTTAAQNQEKVIVGQLYTTSDGKTRLYLNIFNTDNRQYRTILSSWNQTASNGVTIDWGDGSETYTESGTGNKFATHIYEPGQYVLTLKVNSGTATLGFSNRGALSWIGTDSSYNGFYSMLEKVEVGDGISGFAASYLDYDIESLTLTKDITTFSGNSMLYTNRLKCVVFPRVSDTLSSFARYCFGLEAVSLSPTITTLDAYAFANSYVLEHIELGHVVSVGNYCFQNNYKLKRIESKSITSVGNYSFSNCYSLESINFPNLVTIGTTAFEWNDCRSVVVSNSITTLNASGFANMRGIREWTVWSGVTEIPASFFNTCRALEKVTIGSGVTSIAASAFANCIRMTAIIINATTPPTLANVNAFNSSNMAPIYIPANSLSDYKTASNWSTFANRFRPWDYGESDYGFTYYKKTVGGTGSAQKGAIVDSINTCISSHIPIINGHSYTFSGGTADTTYHFCFFNSSGTYVNYYSCNANPRTVTMGWDVSYGILTCLIERLERCFVYDNTAGELVWPVKATT